MNTALSSLDHEQFVATFGSIYEHSAWVAEQAWQQHQQRPFANLDQLQAAMARIVDSASRATRLALIRAHPDLAGKIARAGQLTAESAKEQAGAGLDRCSDREYARFQRLNQQYTQKFGFPFVVAVAGLDRQQILSQFETRTCHDPNQEFDTALEQIHRIAAIRIKALSDSNPRPAIDHFHRSRLNLADPRLGARVIYATDDFFADKQRLISPQEPTFVPDKYDDHGKWMDGWESRRRRDAGHDWCVIELGEPAKLESVEIDTRHFIGNYPPAASLEAIYSPNTAPNNESDWQPLVGQTVLGPDQCKRVRAQHDGPWTHIRLHIFPDGGVARLRVFGQREVDWRRRDRDELIDVAAIENGGCPIGCNDEHFGRLSNILAPGRGVNMGDGWETRRRREPGHDWAIIRLGHTATIEKILIDTAHFKGNYPDGISIQVSGEPAISFESIEAESARWPILLPEQRLTADTEHAFVEAIADHEPACWARINLFPDGGISRLRMFGRLV